MRIKSLFIPIAILPIFFIVYKIYQFHPYQSLYFNNLINYQNIEKYQVDTASLSRADALKNILNQENNNAVINVANASWTPFFNGKDLLKEDDLISSESEQSQVEMYSSLIIQTIQSAWRKPINIQDGLVCDLRLTINQNGRVIKANLIRSSGNIRFDNSALKAVQRVETFNFFNKIPLSIYSSNFKNIVITFNPS